MQTVVSHTPTCEPQEVRRLPKEAWETPVVKVKEIVTSKRQQTSDSACPKTATPSDTS